MFKRNAPVEVELSDGSKERGTVNYVRVSSVDPSEVVAVSVLRESQLSRPGYAGSLFPVAKVRLIESAE